MSINTKAVTRRAIALASIDDMLGEAQRLADAQTQGRLVQRGNWTLGQALGHLASWIDYGYDGYPPEFRAPPWILRLVFKLMKRRFLYGSLPVGMRMPKIKDGTFGTEIIPTSEGVARLSTAAARLARAAPSRPNAAFGMMTHKEWTALHLRHAELHMSFFDVP